MAPGTVPLQNPKGTSRKACLENPESGYGQRLDTVSHDELVSAFSTNMFFSTCFNPNSLLGSNC